MAINPSKAPMAFAPNRSDALEAIRDPTVRVQWIDMSIICAPQ
jgi:hypothetical protein